MTNEEIEKNVKSFMQGFVDLFYKWRSDAGIDASFIGSLGIHDVEKIKIPLNCGRIVKPKTNDNSFKINKFGCTMIELKPDNDKNLKKHANHFNKMMAKQYKPKKRLVKKSK
jgi:hypothetical protein